MAEEKKAVEYLARKDEGPMSKKDFQAVVSSALSECVQFQDSELSDQRALASKYYQGKPFGNEEEGRSQVVLTEVRDAVDGMVPSLLRIALPPGEHAVEFVPTNEGNVAQAEQKTDYVRYVFEEDNAGFLQTLSVLKDGLVRKIGIFKWWWDKTQETQAFKQEGIDEQALQLLAADDSVEFTQITPRKEDGLFDVDFTRTEEDGRIRVESVPPEEFIYNRQARDLDGALVVAHRTDKTRGQLLAMGIKAKDIDEHGSGGETDSSLSGNAEELARRDFTGVGQLGGSGIYNDPDLGRANDRILYAEALMNIDKNGDGKAELLCIHTIGPNFYPVKDYPSTADKGFSIFTPYPEPHSLTGGSVADRTMDVQKINSAILRAIMDSGAASAFPRTVYKEGAASVADIMNTAIGAPIREREIGAVRTLETPFTGKELLPVLQFMQEVIERRTGRNKGAAGLDADALQSTGKDAVNAVLTGGQEQIEVIARVFAEMTLKPLFRGIGRLLSDKQPKARVVRLRGGWSEVDPRTWDENMDVTVNVALGSMFTEKKIATLMAVAADQENMIQQLGLANPATNLPKLLNSRAKILSLQGIKDFESYYNKLAPDWQPPPAPETPPDPSVLAMQAEAEMSHVKAMKELAIKQDELQLKLAEHEMKRQEMAMKAKDSEREQRNTEFEQSFKLEELAINTELKRLEIEVQMASAQQSKDESTKEKKTPQEVKVTTVDPTSITAGMEQLSKSVAKLTEHAAKEKPPVVVPAPNVNVPAPVVNVPAPIVHVAAPAEKKRGKRKVKAKKETDGSYTFETED